MNIEEVIPKSVLKQIKKKEPDREEPAKAQRDLSHDEIKSVEKKVRDLLSKR